MNVNLTAQDQTTIRTAAFGAVTLMSFAGISGSAHRVATDGTLSYASATGAVGHVLASKKNDFKLHAKSAAALADQVLPALTASVHLLEAQDAEEAANFRSTVITAIEAATRAHKGGPSATMTAMAQKITEALDA
jgi:hypothetical protein